MDTSVKGKRIRRTYSGLDDTFLMICAVVNMALHYTVQCRRRLALFQKMLWCVLRITDTAYYFFLLYIDNGVQKLTIDLLQSTF